MGRGAGAADGKGTDEVDQDSEGSPIGILGTLRCRDVPGGGHHLGQPACGITRVCPVRHRDHGPGDAGEADYRVTVLVDGLRREEQRRFANGLRERRVKVRKVRGLRGGNDPVLRLADAAAGLARAAYEGESGLQAMYQGLVTRGLIREVPGKKKPPSGDIP